MSSHFKVDLIKENLQALELKINKKPPFLLALFLEKRP